ncbi:ferritin-like domain-containing protein [Zoogloea sp.]|uniref:ferritin-like domain-containing protein n=1 Tax=Zoogloea sp. TaxID=49181 RepID=UPI001D46FF7D|nr:ferritin-like domain-containing protein [Zoogloea sp.]MBK6652420.1 ferritin-like domain-containing protein [Zoogloea sp.]
MQDFSHVNLQARALEALMSCSPALKAAQVDTLLADWQAGHLVLPEAGALPPPVLDPGRPERPELVPHTELPRRRPGSPGGHAALLHAIAHIEFNAINLALDCAYRFSGLPADYYGAWLGVAAEEAYHFSLIEARLKDLGHAYGDFQAHNGLWEMAIKTADDPLARMALVPRVLEARGLDATPPIVSALKRIGDAETIAVLDIILRDEIGHVALGDRWFRYFCAERGLAPEATYLVLMARFDAPWPPRPLNVEARRKAGFSDAEIACLEAGKAASTVR